jgi:hypothetical protein
LYPNFRDRTLEEFEADWRETYFVDCPTKKDTEITDDDIRDKNLIVFGDADTNSLIKRAAGSPPIQKTSHGISIEGKNVDGDQLAYIFLFPNPLNLKKYIVEIGMNQWKAVKGWRLHLPRNGVCDYFVFDLQKPAPRLIDAGYFDHVW